MSRDKCRLLLHRLTWDEDSYKIFDPSRVPDGTMDIPKQVFFIPK